MMAPSDTLKEEDKYVVKEDKKVVRVLYTNYRGETSARAIIPKAIFFGSNEWHKDPQWLLTAFDIDKQADRDFAIKGIKSWSVRQ